MVEKVFLINRNKTDLTPQDLNGKSVPELIPLSDYVINACDAVKCLTGSKALNQVEDIIRIAGTTTPEVKMDDYMFIAKTMEVEEIGFALHNEDCKDLVINEELEVHIRRNDTGYSFDFYKHASASAMEDDDYDFDGDFINGTVILDDELGEPETIEVTTRSLDGDDVERTEEWYLSGLRLTSTFDTCIVEDKDDLIDTIIESTHDLVTCITLGDTVIYED